MACLPIPGEWHRATAAWWPTFVVPARASTVARTFRRFLSGGLRRGRYMEERLIHGAMISRLAGRAAVPAYRWQQGCALLHTEPILRGPSVTPPMSTA